MGNYIRCLRMAIRIVTSQVASVVVAEIILTIIVHKISVTHRCLCGENEWLPQQAEALRAIWGIFTPSTADYRQPAVTSYSFVQTLRHRRSLIWIMAILSIRNSYLSDL